MKKTLAVLMAALLAAVCFATIGSAATISASLNEDYADVTATKDLSKLFDGVTYVEKNEITEGADAWKTDGSAYTQGDIVLFKNAKATDKTAGTKLVLNIDLGEAKDLDNVVVYFFKEYSSMIGLGVSNTMTISASTDGETYNKVGDFEFDSEPALQEDNKTTNGVLGVYPETFEFEETVNARYLELALPYEESADTFYVTPNDPESGVKGIWEWTYMPVITQACDMCAERTEQGKMPMCVQHCQAWCMYYGEAEELVKKMDGQTRWSLVTVKE